LNYSTKPLLILNTGLRLREAYTLTRGQIDMENKVSCPPFFVFQGSMVSIET